MNVNGLTPGEHGFHIHAVGKCEPPFTSAGPHFNPNERKHGLQSREGHHAGDMRNLRVLKSGKATATLTNAGVTLEKDKPNSLFKEGGTGLWFMPSRTISSRILPGIPATESPAG